MHCHGCAASRAESPREEPGEAKIVTRGMILGSRYWTRPGHASTSFAHVGVSSYTSRAASHRATTNRMSNEQEMSDLSTLGKADRRRIIGEIRADLSPRRFLLPLARPDRGAGRFPRARDAHPRSPGTPKRHAAP